MQKRHIKFRFCVYYVFFDDRLHNRLLFFIYITVTLFARFLGLSGSNPRHKDAVSASD